MIEGKNKDGVGVQFPWEPHPRRDHKHTMSVGPYYIGKYPVTISEYAEYLAATDFRPRDPHNWLKNWGGSRTPPPSVLELPVTYVGLEEARAYCKWKGARLPHSYELLYAAQGNDNRTYPWGNENDASLRPQLTDGNVFTGPVAVGQYPGGASPFGLEDVV